MAIALWSALVVFSFAVSISQIQHVRAYLNLNKKVLRSYPSQVIMEMDCCPKNYMLTSRSAFAPAR